MPSNSPTSSPSRNPSSMPSAFPSSMPSNSPTLSPSRSPSSTPSINPTALPSSEPSSEPSLIPSSSSVEATAISLLSPFFTEDLPDNPVQQQALDELILNDDGLIATENADRLLDRFVMFIFYFANNGDSWNIKTNWLSGSVCSSWRGIVCSGSRVVSMGAGNTLGECTLKQHHLSPSPLLVLSLTPLPPSHENKCIDANNLDGTIPTELGTLSQLTFLQLSKYRFHLLS